jgi:hypothetical protein
LSRVGPQYVVIITLLPMDQRSVISDDNFNNFDLPPQD